MPKELTDYELNMEAARLEYAARRKPDELTMETAQAYVANYFEKNTFFGDPITISGADWNEEYGDGELIEVNFTFASEPGKTYSMAVWLESGKLYGEW